MKLAVLSDIHANQRALLACLTHAREAGAEHFAFLGDLVGYGAEPAEVLSTVMALCQAGQAWALQGNHDALAVQPVVVSSDLQTQAHRTAGWTHAQLTDGQRNFLATLPLLREDGRTLWVHASAHHPEKWLYVDGERQAGLCLDAAQQRQRRQVFVGHVHHQGLYYLNSRHEVMRFQPTPGVPLPLTVYRDWVCTVGSVGQPRDGDARAMYVLYDDGAKRLVFQRVPYDVDAAAQAIRRAGLPESFASRLELGR